MSDDVNQWSSIKPLTTQERGALAWVPEEARERIAAYFKYDEIYWNDGRQYRLRVLEGETPLYIPNARTVVDTTAHFLLKGLTLTCENATTKKVLDEFLKREVFYSRFHAAKQSGVGRGDYVFHLTANPNKPDGTRVSLNSVEPMNVFPIWDEAVAGKMIRCHIAVPWTDPDDPTKVYLRRLTYNLEEKEGVRKVSRQEDLWELENAWSPNGAKAKRKKVLLPFGYLDPAITQIPVYWFKNRGWQGEDFGSSELRGLETIQQIISQGSTDVSASLSLEGLGVYATDGGRPVSDTGVETDWEVAPGRVMEVPSGSYFRRVEGVGSITPATDQIHYLEEKMNDAVGLSDVALGKVDAQVASSGIALAIKFMPTLAKIEMRDQEGLDRLTQLFFDWKTWYGVFEHQLLDGDIIPVIGDKLPTDRVAKVNELNNMLDRKVISTQFYRDEMEKLGYDFPDKIVDQIKDDLLLTRFASETENAAEQEASPGEGKSGNGSGSNGDTLEEESKSNNKSRPNESSGTEATKKTRDA